MKGGQKPFRAQVFPGYVLCEMEMDDDDPGILVKNTPKVTGFVGGTANRRPRFPEGSRQDHAADAGRVEKPRPKVLFEVGEVVRVKEGPFTDFHGAVEDVNYEKNRLRFGDHFWSCTPVELEFGQVEKPDQFLGPPEAPISARGASA